MTSYVRVALAAIAVVAVVGWAAYVLRPREQVGGTAWTTYTSSRFAYSIRHPAEWLVTPATGDWPDHHLPTPFGPTVDRFGASRGGDTYVFATSDRLDPDQVAAERIAQLDFVNAGEGGSPACLASNRHTITLDRVDARQEDLFCFGKDHLIEVAVIHDGRFYLVDFLSSHVPSQTDKTTFDRFLASFEFGR